jgi:hypothetical protein
MGGGEREIWLGGGGEIGWGKGKEGEGSEEKTEERQMGGGRWGEG